MFLTRLSLSSSLISRNVYDNYYVEPSLNTHVSPRILGHIRPYSGIYYVSDIDSDGMNEIILIGTPFDGEYSLLVYGVDGLEYSLSIDSLARYTSYYTIYTVYGDTIYLIMVYYLYDNLLNKTTIIPELITVIHGDGYNYTRRLLDHYTYTGFPLLVGRETLGNGLCLDGRYLVFEVYAHTKYVTYIVDLHSYNVSIVEGNVGISWFYISDYIKVDSRYYVISINNLIVIDNYSLTTMDLELGDLGYQYVVSVDIIPINDTLYIIIVGGNSSHNRNTYMMHIFRYSISTGSIEFYGGTYMDVYNVLYTPIITSDHVFVFGVNGSKTQIYIYDLLNNGTEMKTFPIGVSGAIGINTDGNIYLYVYSNISGYYIYDPFNDMYTYITLEMPREIYAGVDGFTIVQPLLADLDGDDTLESTYIVIRYNRSDYGLMPIDSYVVCSGIDYPENLLPLPQYPLLPMITFVLLIIHLFMRRPK